MSYHEPLGLSSQVIVDYGGWPRRVVWRWCRKVLVFSPLWVSYSSFMFSYSWFQGGWVSLRVRLFEGSPVFLPCSSFVRNFKCVFSSRCNDWRRAYLVLFPDFFLFCPSPHVYIVLNTSAIHPLCGHVTHWALFQRYAGLLWIHKTLFQIYRAFFCQ